MRTRLMACGLAVLASTCGGDRDISLDDWPTEFGRAVCAKLYSCCPADRLRDNMQAGPDQKTCESNYAAALARGVSRIKDAQAKGRVAYHGDKAAACLDAFGAVACSSLGGRRPPPEARICVEYIEPLVAPGGACGESAECIMGRCERSGPEDGVCMARVATGGTCQFVEDCVADDYCDASGVCQVLKPPGAACVSSDECNSETCVGDACVNGDGCPYGTKIRTGPTWLDLLGPG